MADDTLFVENQSEQEEGAAASIWIIVDPFIDSYFVLVFDSHLNEGPVEK